MNAKQRFHVVLFLRASTNDFHLHSFKVLLFTLSNAKLPEKYRCKTSNRRGESCCLLHVVIRRFFPSNHLAERHRYSSEIKRIIRNSSQSDLREATILRLQTILFFFSDLVAESLRSGRFVPVGKYSSVRSELSRSREKTIFNRKMIFFCRNLDARRNHSRRHFRQLDGPGASNVGLVADVTPFNCH